ncbi:MAG: terpene cyclase/mutase family protein [Planctomycetes bacterium]|nr:terpene cyclase/mutase family protein [Planctomycetota bacterium]
MPAAIRRRRRALAALALAATALCVRTDAQQAGPLTAEEIMDRAARAQWGERPEVLKSYRMEETLTFAARQIDGRIIAPPAVGTVLTQAKAPDQVYTKLEIPGLPVVEEGFDGTVGWVKEGKSAVREKEGPELAHAEDAARFYGMAGWRKRYKRVIPRGEDSVGGRRFYVFQVEVEDLEPAILSIDADSFLPTSLRRTTKGARGTIEIETRFLDYKPLAEGELAGVLLPRRTVRSEAGQTFERVVTRIEPNVPVLDALFHPPSEKEFEETEPANEVFGGRRGKSAEKAVKAGGGGETTESAVIAGLKWLARHQSADGGWSGKDFGVQCRTSICSGRGDAAYDVGVTGLAILALLGAGYTPASKEAYKDPHLDREICWGEVIGHGLRWLMRNQDIDGCFGGQKGGKYMYNHLIAATAMAEAYGMTQSALLKESAQLGVDFTLAAQNPYKGWRYAKRCGDNDTVVTGWACFSLKIADFAGLEVSRAGFDGARAWMQEVTDDLSYQAGYTAKGTGQVVHAENQGYAPHETTTAIAMTCRMLLDRDKRDRALEGGMRLLADDLPSWNPAAKKNDAHYWHWATLALFHYNGPRGQYWAAWNKALVAALTWNRNTARDSCADGSWDAETQQGMDRWGYAGGRVYATAMNTLTLEVYSRYGSFLKATAGGDGKKK